MAGLQPNVVTDVSFQLSFAATAGLVVLEPLLRRRIEDAWQRIRWLPELPRQGLAAGLFEIAIITTCRRHRHAAVDSALLPAHLAHRGTSEPAGAPAFPYIMLSSTLVAVLGLVSGTLAQHAGYFAWLGLSYMIEMVRLMAAVPFASLEVRRFNTEMCVASYGLLARSAGCHRKRPGEEGFRRFGSYCDGSWRCRATARCGVSLLVDGRAGARGDSCLVAGPVVTRQPIRGNVRGTGRASNRRGVRRRAGRFHPHHHARRAEAAGRRRARRGGDRAGTG